MKKRERVLAALNNQEVDRVPVGLWFHFVGDEAKGQGCIDAHLNFYNEVDPDMIKIMSDSYFPYPIQPEITQASDWYKLKPLGPTHPFIREQVERVKAVVQGTGGECPTFYNVFAPFSSIRFGSSDDLVMQHIKEDPEAVMFALNVIAQDNSTIAELCITEGGCDGIYYCLQGGELDRFTAEEYNKYISPSDVAVIEHANKFSENNILHCCGWAGDKNRLQNWKDYPVKAVNWAVFVEEASLTEGKKLFNKTVFGGLDNRPGGPLVSGSREDIEAAVKDIIKEMGDTGYFIAADCTLPATIERERIRWVIEATKK